MSKRKSPPAASPPAKRPTVPPAMAAVLFRTTGSQDCDPTELTQSEEAFLAAAPVAERRQMQAALASMRKAPSSGVPRRMRVLQSRLPPDVKSDAFHKLATAHDPKYTEWVDAALRLPLGVHAPPPALKSVPALLKRAARVMDREIVGHTDAKRAVLRVLSDWAHGRSGAGFALGLEGQPGIGKTSFAKHALAKAVDRPFCFVGLGGALDVSVLLGHSYTYEGAVHGRLAECLIASGTMDPIIFFDELDKISNTAKGDELVHALIHLTDTVQNGHIVDKYFSTIPFDLSRAMLVFSYNDARRVHPVLLDRLRRIRMAAPTADEKRRICISHLIPRAVGRYAGSNPIDVNDEVISLLLRRNDKTCGMRGIEQDIDLLVSSARLIKTCADGSMLGIKAGSTARLDRPLAEGLLAATDQQRACDASAAPPVGMYT